MDVLRYSATNAETYLRTQCTEKTTCLPTRTTCLSNSNACLSTVCSQVSALQATAAAVGPEAGCWATFIEPCLLREPFRTAFWSCIPAGSGWTGGIRVCRCAGNPIFNYGSCCAWTVPGGATCARFQIWGAGGGSGAAGCCGGSVFGSTGAYASVIIPVSAGQVYTLCAGCAFQCFPTRLSGTGRFPGCPSFVLGTGLSNFCANGGQGRMGTWMQMYGRRNPRRLANVAWNYGWCLCGQGTYFCAATSNSRSNGEIPYVAGASYFGSTTNNSLVYGIRGMWNRACWEPFQGYFVHPPIYGFESTSQCCFTWTATCCGRTCSACCGFLAIPGAGGVPSTSTFQNYGACGDMGKGGMVCVCFR